MAPWILEQRNGLAACVGVQMQMYGWAALPLILTELMEVDVDYSWSIAQSFTKRRFLSFTRGDLQ